MRVRETNWKWVKLIDAVDVLDNMRKPINSSERQLRISGKDESELFPYYGATGQVGWIDDFIVEGEYILVGEDGAPFLDHFKQKAYKIGGKSWVNNHAHILKGKENVSLDSFVLHYLNSINYKEHVNGTTRLKLTKSSLVDIPFPLPPVKVQQAIVSKIESLFAELDKGKQQLEAAREKLKTYRQAVLKWAFEDILNTRTVKVEDCCSHVVDCLHSTAKFVAEGRYCIDTTCIENGWIDFEKARFVSEKTFEERISRLKPIEGDILFAREGTVGTTAIVPHGVELCLGQRMMMFRLFKDISPKYIMFYFQSPLFMFQYLPLIMGTTAPHLNIRDIRKFEVILCGSDDQIQVVDQIEGRLSACDRIEESIRISLHHCEELKQSILKRAFEGKLN